MRLDWIFHQKATEQLQRIVVHIRLSRYNLICVGRFYTGLFYSSKCQSAISHFGIRYDSQ